MFVAPVNMRVYLAMGHTDMRKAINGLSVLVESRMQLDPYSKGALLAQERLLSMAEASGEAPVPVA